MQIHMIKKNKQKKKKLPLLVTHFTNENIKKMIILRMTVIAMSLSVWTLHVDYADL